MPQTGLGISTPETRRMLKENKVAVPLRSSHYGSSFFLIIHFVKSNGENTNPEGEISLFSLARTGNP